MLFQFSMLSGQSIEVGPALRDIILKLGCGLRVYRNGIKMFAVRHGRSNL